MQLPNRFINWRTMNGRKVPCRPDGTPIDPHDQANHLTQGQANASPHPIGFVLRAEDGLFFLDLDKCRDASGEWTTEASSIFQSFTGAWAEVSQSGKGLHILGRCDPSKLQDRKNKWDGWLEFYTDKRFIAFGPHGWSQIGGPSNGDKDWTNQLLRMVPQREHLGELPEGVDPSYTGPADDAELIRKMLATTGAAGAFGGVTVKDLWEANAETLGRKWPAYDGKGDFDHSSADAALMSHLAFWTGKDMPRMDRLFRQSGLMRDKYEKRDDYRRDTIQKAARLCNKVYDVPATTASQSDPQRLEELLTVPEMIEYFNGCIYVRDIHRVLVPDGSLLRPEQFNAVYGGHEFVISHASSAKPVTEAFKALTTCRAHRFPQAKGTTFRPDLPTGTIVEDDVNIYKKPDIDIRPGDVTPFLTFLGKLLPDERDRTILLSWCAAAVQNPGVKFQWAPVLQGVEGNGKTMLAECVAYVLGDKYVHTPPAEHLGGNFNSYLENKLLQIVEEFYAGSRRQMLDTMKPLITNRRIQVEQKGVDQRMIDNVCNWFFCTNHKDAVLINRSTRRYAIFYTAQQDAADLKACGMGGDYFPKLYTWMRDEGYAFMAHYLLNYDIQDDFNPAGKCHRAPETTSTAEAINASLGGIESEIVEASESGRVGFKGGWVSSWALEQLLKEKGIKVSPPKRGEILRAMGYRSIGRAGRAIQSENNMRPALWKKTPGVGTQEEYMTCQGNTYT